MTSSDQPKESQQHFLRNLAAFVTMAGYPGKELQIETSSTKGALTVTDTAAPDPFVVHANGKWYLTCTAHPHVEIRCSSNPLDLSIRNSKTTVVWEAQRPRYDHVWSPELHAVQGRWWIYFAAADRNIPGGSHRVLVLQGPPSSEDPCQKKQWKFLGAVQGLPDRWGIDATMCYIKNELYIIWSGWPPGATNDLEQQIYIAKLEDPSRAISEATCISCADFPWEISCDHNGAHKINEGPQWFEDTVNRSFAGVIYACAGSWTCDYKLAVIKYNGGDPLDPSSWNKMSRPLLESRDSKPFGPGHCSFCPLDNDTTLFIYHATDNKDDGWRNRKARAQKLIYENGLPRILPIDHSPGEDSLIGKLKKILKGFFEC